MAVDLSTPLKAIFMKVAAPAPNLGTPLKTIVMRAPPPAPAPTVVSAAEVAMNGPSDPFSTTDPLSTIAAASSPAADPTPIASGLTAFMKKKVFDNITVGEIGFGMVVSIVGSKLLKLW